MEAFISAPSAEWVEGDGIIYLNVLSNGFSGNDWADYFLSSESISDFGVIALRSPGFVYTKNLFTKVAIIKSSRLLKEQRETKIIKEIAHNLDYIDSRSELGCLLCKNLSASDLKSMKLEAIVPMHEPIKCSDGIDRLIYTAQKHGKKNFLSACYKRDKGLWPDNYGFAFEVQ